MGQLPALLPLLHNPHSASHTACGAWPLQCVALGLLIGLVQPAGLWSLLYEAACHPCSPPRAFCLAHLSRPPYANPHYSRKWEAANAPLLSYAVG